MCTAAHTCIQALPVLQRFQHSVITGTRRPNLQSQFPHLCSDVPGNWELPAFPFLPDDFSEASNAIETTFASWNTIWSQEALPLEPTVCPRGPSRPPCSSPCCCTPRSPPLFQLPTLHGPRPGAQGTWDSVSVICVTGAPRTVPDTLKTLGKCLLHKCRQIRGPRWLRNSITSILPMKTGTTYLRPLTAQDGVGTDPGALPTGMTRWPRVCSGQELTTGRAAVRPLTRVPNSVLYQLPLHVKRLSTLITGEDFISRVCLFVLLQITEVTEP